MQANRFLIQNRARKVSIMVEVARARRITANQILDLETGESDQSAILMLEDQLKLRLPTSGPPSATTWMMVRGALEGLERLDATAGMPLLKDCGCSDRQCCFSCCAFPTCSDCGQAVAS